MDSCRGIPIVHSEDDSLSKMCSFNSGNALEEDLNLGELSLSSVDREIGKDNDNDTNSVCSSIGFPSTSNSCKNLIPFV